MSIYIVHRHRKTSNALLSVELLCVSTTYIIREAVCYARSGPVRVPDHIISY